MIAKVLAGDRARRRSGSRSRCPRACSSSDASDVMEVLNRVKALGVRVAMDDFGAGYSGLASLARFPFDKIKIDRTFVAQLTEDADVAAIVAAIVALGRTLSVDVTAEGVETSEQVTLLKAAGCSIVQGFLFGVPKRETLSARPNDGIADGHKARASCGGRPRAECRSNCPRRVHRRLRTGSNSHRGGVGAP